MKEKLGCPVPGGTSGEGYLLLSMSDLNILTFTLLPTLKYILFFMDRKLPTTSLRDSSFC